MRQLQAALSELRRAGRFQVTVMPGRTGLATQQAEEVRAAGFELVDGATTLDEIVRRLPDFHVLHLLAHGSYEDGQSWLHLEQEDGTWARCPEASIVDKIGKLTSQPHLIFLAACDSARLSSSATNAFVGLAPQLIRGWDPGSDRHAGSGNPCGCPAVDGRFLPAVVEPRPGGPGAQRGAQLAEPPQQLRLGDPGALYAPAPGTAAG